MFGISLAALGMLSTLATCLSIDVFGPVCDNAGGIAEMAGCHESVRAKTDSLDAAGNTTAAIGKGFAIGSAALVSLALFGAFSTKVGWLEQYGVNMLRPVTFSFLIIGAMLPYVVFVFENVITFLCLSYVTQITRICLASLTSIF